MSKIQLPIDLYLPQILDHLKTNPRLILSASPGAGKTTRLPAALAFSKASVLSKPQVLVLEPRRLAARLAATRVALEQGHQLGRETGFQIRFTRQTSKDTQLIYLTEALLLRRLLNDPRLDQVGAVVFDEFHERNWYSDLALSLLVELQTLERPDLKIVVMSATLEVEGLKRFLESPLVVDVSAQRFPLEIGHFQKSQILDSGRELTSRVCDLVEQVVRGQCPSQGDILVFLPGAGEITRAQSELERRITDLPISIFPLHGSLSSEAQDLALAPNRLRKVILSTNVAETSLTIDGVGTVIDSGLARAMERGTTGFSRLQLGRVAMTSVVQRSGRAARQGPGFAYRLWTAMEERGFRERETPEILRMDLSEVVLMLAALGVREPQNFSWFEAPPLSEMMQAQTRLREYGALTPSGDLTDCGRFLARLPLPPRLGFLLYVSFARGSESVGRRIVAALSQNFSFDRADTHAVPLELESDVLRLLHQRSLQSQLRQSEDQIRDLRPEHIENRWGERHPDDDQEVLRLLAIAFIDRLACRRPHEPQRATMTGRLGINIAPESVVKQSPLFVALDGIEIGTSRTRQTQVAMASRVAMEWLEFIEPQSLSQKHDVIIDEKSGQAIQLSGLYFRDLPINEPQRRGATADEAFLALFHEVTQNFEALLAQHATATKWLERFRFLQKSDLTKFPDRDFSQDKELVESLVYGENRLSAILAKDWIPFLERTLTPQQKQWMRTEAPTRLELRDEQTAEISYSAERPPAAQVRLRDLFGVFTSPVVGFGKVPVQIEILGPHGRPIQVTSNLVSFWQTSYPEIRKEMRGRYPKQHWPEDPRILPPPRPPRRT